MTTVALGLDPVFKKFPTISREAQKIADALSRVESGTRLATGFSPYALACQNLISSSAKLRTAHKDLDAALQALSKRVQKAAAKIGPSELLAAIRSDDVKLVWNILKASDLQNKKLSNGETPLHYAIRSGSTEVVKYLLNSAQFNPLARDHQGLTAFDHAFIKNDKKMIALVLGSALGIQAPESALPAKGDIPEMQLISQEITGLRRPPVSKLPPLHAAAFLDDLQGLEKLAGSDLNAVDANGMTALHYAVLGGRDGALQWLLAKGAKLEVKAKNGMNLLHFAVIGGSDALIKRLLDTKKFDPNSTEGRGRTALHFAIATDKIGAARAIIERGGDPFIKTMQMTPFAILEVVSRVRSEIRDPLRLDLSSLSVLSSFAISAVCHYFGDAKAEGFPKYLSIASKVFSALPVLTTLFKTSRSGGSPMKTIPASMAFTGGLFGYLLDNNDTKTYFEAGHSLYLGKTLIDQLQNSWKNSALETYRPLRNVLVHTASALFAAYQFMYTSGIKKQMVCKFGTSAQCILQPDLEPRWQEQPMCQINSKPFDPSISYDTKTLEKLCTQEAPQEPLSACVPRIRENIKARTTQCYNAVKNDAELIMGLGGYGSGKTLDKAYDTLKNEFCKASAACDTSKIDAAHNFLKTLLSIEWLFCLPLANLDKMSEPEKITALNPKCEDHAEMILGLKTGYTKEDCKQGFKKLSKTYHPDKNKVKNDPALNRLYAERLAPARDLLCPLKSQDTVILL
jgi:ankyrin repeat protein